MSDVQTFLLLYTPKADFITDVIAFETVIIGIAVPISFEIISRTSDRYKSDAITTRFKQSLTVKALPVFIVINIITGILLRFFESNTDLWVGIAWFALIGIIIAAIWLLYFFSYLLTFLDTKALLKRFTNDIKDVLNT